MFNDILTGKASVAPEPAPMEPYREQGALPPVTETCVGCGMSFKAPAGTVATHCPSCQLRTFELNAQNDRMAFLAAEEDHRRKQNSQRLFAIIGGVVVLIGLVFFRYGMRSQRRDDAAQAAGYSDYDDYKRERAAVRLYPSDDYSRQLDSLASDMCYCKDLKCARDVQTKYVNYVRTHGPSDDDSEASARASIEKLGTCQATIEAGGMPTAP